MKIKCIRTEPARPPPPPRGFKLTLELNEDEVQALRSLCGCIAGSPTQSHRRLTQEISAALSSHGIEFKSEYFTGTLHATLIRQ